MGKVTTVWLSSTVVKVRFLIHGTGVFRGTTEHQKIDRREHTNTEDVSFHSNTHTQRSDIEQQETFSLLAARVVGQDGGLNSSTVSNTLIRVNRLVQCSSAKDVGDEFLNLGNSGGSTNQDNIINIVLVDLGVFEDRFNRCNGRLESLVIDRLKSSPSDGRCEIMTLVQRINFNFGLSDTGQSPLRSLASTSKSSLSTCVLADIQTSLLLKFCLEMLKEGVVEILAPKMGISRNSLHSENTIGDCKKGDIESSTSKIEDQDILLLG